MMISSLGCKIIQPSQSDIISCRVHYVVDEKLLRAVNNILQDLNNIKFQMHTFHLSLEVCFNRVNDSSIASLSRIHVSVSLNITGKQ